MSLIYLLALTANIGFNLVLAQNCDFKVTHLTVDYTHSVYTSSSDNVESFLPIVSDSPSPLLGWWLTSSLGAGVSGNSSQSSYRIFVASTPDLLTNPDIWDSGQVQSSQSVAIKYSGPLLASQTRVFWQVEVFQGSNSCGRSDEVSAWEVPLLSANDWQGAEWIQQDLPVNNTDCNYYVDKPSPLFRFPFTLTKPSVSVVKARLYVVGLGYFRPYFDGVTVGNDILAPAWTDFNQSVLYSTFDLTSQVTAGSNHVLGIACGNGWWNLAPLRFWGSRDFRAALPTGVPMARALLVIQYSDKTTQSITTSSEWSVGGSEVLFNSIYLGTRIDRRLEPVNWSSTTFSQQWPPSIIASSPPPGVLRSERTPPVRKQSALNITSLPAAPGELVLDAGKNFAGVCRICFSGGAPPGAAIHFRYGELLYANGSVNGMTSVAGQIKNGKGANCSPLTAFQEDHYVMRGDIDGECFEPPFTWHGSRYIMVTGDNSAVSRLSVTSTQCFPLRSDVDVIGSFNSSSDLLNKIHAASVNTAESNMMSIQSDCPHRERLGYGGDALMSGESLLNTFDMSLFYEKRLNDYVDAQRNNGGFSETAPFVGISDAGLGDDSGPIGWQTFAPAVAMWLIKYFDNTPALERTYESLTEYVSFLDIVDESKIMNGLGDWMTLEPSALPLTGLGFQHISYLEYSNISAILGNVSQAQKYATSAANIAAKINSLFLDESTGRYAAANVFNSTQCGQSMPLFLQIVPPDSTEKVQQVLIDNLASHQGHLQVGSFGIKYLLMSLIDAGRPDLAYGIMNKTDFPSFGYMLDERVNNLTSATTIWESWFTSDNTYSHSHPMFTSNVVYDMQGLVGITPAPSSRGYNSVIFRPSPPSTSLDYVKGSLITQRGLVSSEWQVFPNRTFMLTICVPPNMKAEVWMPGLSKQRFDPGTCCGCTFYDQI
jgi:alpha-L-rhamnosidase